MTSGNDADQSQAQLRNASGDGDDAPLEVMVARPGDGAARELGFNGVPSGWDYRAGAEVVPMASSCPPSARTTEVMERAGTTSGAATSSTAQGGERPPRTARSEVEALAYEDQHVHSVYDAIAGHFSSTRYKPWPFVASFLQSLAPGSVGLDVGCGNGKYLTVRRDIVLLGCDRSAALVALARNHQGLADQDAAQTSKRKCEPNQQPDRKNEVLVADSLNLPFRPRGVDFVICIAVLHHLSTRERRQEGIRRLLECANDAGKVLVYVWALEQGMSRRGWEEGGEQDLLVPWVTKGKRTETQTQTQARAAEAAEGSRAEDTTYQRYYHLYRKGELEEDVVEAGGLVLECGYEKDNWWAICGRKEE
jgi:tRNA (uracil-5-)-methyltransferase TRM9